MTIARQVFIISDLHLGGAASADGKGRGFRMCTQGPVLAAFIDELTRREPRPVRTELVINGDFVDFLAEGDENGAWSPFTADPAAAAAKLREIVGREAAVFSALARFLTRGHRMTILLGNHDVELSFPLVRAALFQLLDPAGSGDLHFIYDGEAYVVGDALIEHGNRYDGFNVVDHNHLREVRSLQSRRQPVNPGVFSPPPGSQLVVQVMNPIKKDYPFVDLLKPETEAVLPILLALEPGYRRHVLRLLELGTAAAGARPEGSVVFRGEAATTHVSDAVRGGALAVEGLVLGEEIALRQALGKVMTTVEADVFLQSLPRAEEEVLRGDLTRAAVMEANTMRGGVLEHLPRVAAALGFLRLLLFSGTADVERRLPSLLSALRVLKGNHTFDRTVETGAAYLNAARERVGAGFRYVIFGHTHLAKKVSLGAGLDGKERSYLNSGTWADLVMLPPALFDPSEEQALAFLRGWIQKLPRPDQFITFQPTYIRLDVSAADPGLIERAELCDFDPRSPQV